MWSALESAMQQPADRRTPLRATGRRILTFARPHRATIVTYLGLATFSAVLGVAIAGPGRAGRRRDRAAATPPSVVVAHRRGDRR